MRRIAILPLLILVTASCSSNSPDKAANPSTGGGSSSSGGGSPAGNAGGGGTAGNPDEGGLGSCIGGRPWKATSTRFELRSFGFVQGSSGYESDRSALSAVQLSALDALCIIPTPAGSGGYDYSTYAIKIADADGSVSTYRAVQDNAINMGEPEAATRLDVYSLAPFLATFDCLSAAETRVPDRATDGGSDAGPWSVAATVHAESSGCLNGVFTPRACADLWLKLSVAQPGPYQLRTIDCLGTTSIELFSTDGSVELASASSTPPACPSVSYQFAEAGTYLLVLRRANCNEFNDSMGDFFFQVSPARGDAGAPTP